MTETSRVQQHILTPNTAMAFSATYSFPAPPSTVHSPESVYSVQTPAIVFDPAAQARADGRQFTQEELYEMEEEADMVEDEDDGADDGWAPTWGRWGTPSGWMSPPPGGRSSISSISPRESLASSYRMSSIDRRTSLKLGAGGDRRNSSPHLLGFGLTAQRRAHGSIPRRRSSALSTTPSSFDQMEDTRLRGFAGLGLLQRRFSEVIEGEYWSSEDEDVTRARRAAAARWSLDSSAIGEDAREHFDDDDDSEMEIKTASYASTPDFPWAAPAILSNFPLGSVAVPHPPASTTSFPSRPASPLIFSANAPLSAYTFPAIESRPSLHRAATELAPPRLSSGTELSRTTSTPLYPATVREPAYVVDRERGTGSYPVARATPLGVTPLRSSVRRQSVMSDSDTSRRGSLARRESKASVSGSDSARRGSLSDRRLSLIRASAERQRKASQETSSSRKSSVAGGSVQQPVGAGGSAMSSTVSLGEYGYLGPSIVVAAPPAVPVSQAVAVPRDPPMNRWRAKAPAHITLPEYKFPSQSSLETPTPRSAPYTFPAISPPLATSPLSPALATPLPLFGANSRTPRAGPSRLPRAHPASPPQYDSYPFRTLPLSPKSVATSPATAARPLLSPQPSGLALTMPPVTENRVEERQVAKVSPSVKFAEKVYVGGMRRRSSCSSASSGAASPGVESGLSSSFGLEERAVSAEGKRRAGVTSPFSRFFRSRTKAPPSPGGSGEGKVGLPVLKRSLSADALRRVDQSAGGQ
ncbi:hypothetical protein IAT38_002829 [Cryptococcus sp. DSM 104549]